MCSQSAYGMYWEAKLGTNATHYCKEFLNGSIGISWWFCDPVQESFLTPKPDRSACESPWVEEVVDMMHHDDVSAFKVWRLHNCHFKCIALCQCIGLLCKVTEAIISGLTSSDVIFGGDLTTVVSLFDPIIKMYDSAKAESFVLATNMFRISNILIATSEAWEDITNFGERYILSTGILSNVDSMGFLFLSENPLNKGPIVFNFSNVEVILDQFTSIALLSLPKCYQFKQVSLVNLSKTTKICIVFDQMLVNRVQSVFQKKYTAAQICLTMGSPQQLSSTTRRIYYFHLSKMILRQIYRLSSAFP